MGQEEINRVLMFSVFVVLCAYEFATVKAIRTYRKTEALKDEARLASDTESLSKNIFNEASETRKREGKVKAVTTQSGILSARNVDHPADKTKNIYLPDSEKVSSNISHSKSNGRKDSMTKYMRRTLHLFYEIDGKNVEKHSVENRSFVQKTSVKHGNSDLKLVRKSNIINKFNTADKPRKSNENYLRNITYLGKANFTISYDNKNLKHKETILERTERSFRAETYTPHNRTEYVKTDMLQTCVITLYERSKTMFHSQLISREPNFIQFSLLICDAHSARPSFTDDVFMGQRWFWTYNTSSGPFPFLSWNLDYGILSFHLLEAGTINVPYVCIKSLPPYPYGPCEFTFGKHETSETVTNALIPLINVTEGSDIIKYPESYFCYLATRQDYFNTLHYWAAVYLYYPIRFVHYKCCLVRMNYTSSEYETKCQDGDKDSSGVPTWSVTTKLPYFLGILFLMYFPVMLFNITAWLSKDEIILEDLSNFEMNDDFESQDTIENNWIFANGCSPCTLGDLLSFRTIGLSLHPVIVSRLRRLLFVLSFPIFIYIQIAMYAEGMGLWSEGKIQVRDLVKVGTPMGFLALLGDAEDRRKVFVPILGGPLGIVLIYYTLSLLFIALPRSVKQVVETGLPTSNLFIRSPLFLGSRKIIEMSNINVKQCHMKPGYTKAATLMKCRFYMLFTKEFWKMLWKIQVERIRITDSRCCLAFCFFLPFYVVFCAIEIILCILYHGLPFCTFVSGMINGGLKSLPYLKGQSKLLNSIFKYRITCFIGVSTMFLLYMIYIYVIFLVFIISLGFIFNVITHCFVAIIIYPSVSFGYLFFFIVLSYYFINLIRDFGAGYTELLFTAVDVSRHLVLDESRIAVIDGHLLISNAHIENIVDVQINEISLQIPENILRRIQRTRVVKIKERDSAYGIPKRLFEHVVAKHRPVHQQVINLCFKAVIMITFVILTFSTTANYVGGPTTEISEVMHVIFIVAVGAVPQLVQAILSRSDTLLKHEIEEREIEKSITEFWNQETTRSVYRLNYGSI